MKKFISILIATFILFPFAMAHAPAPKKWTFLVFISGNNFRDMGERHIRYMEQVGSNDQINIVVEWGSYSTHKVLRLLVQKSTDPSRITSPILQDLGAVDMG